MPWADHTKNQAAVKQWVQDHPQQAAETRQRSADKLRAEVITAYGGKCACCNEDRLVFLTIDHIDGQGAAERRRDGHSGGNRQWYYLRRRGFPPGYRVLCWNCNLATHILGRCPHQDPSLFANRTAATVLAEIAERRKARQSPKVPYPDGIVVTERPDGMLVITCAACGWTGSAQRTYSNIRSQVWRHVRSGMHNGRPRKLVYDIQRRESERRLYEAERLIAEGLTRQDIAARLGYAHAASLNTVLCSWRKRGRPTPPTEEAA